jgi:penicillin G amidase
MLTLAGGCGGGDATGPDANDPPPAGPYDAVPLGVDLNLPGLEAPVHVVRDEFGILHIHAENTRDLAFVQGYMMAHDRLPQMDILRRFGAGELAELFGALEGDVIETDLEMRLHRMRPLA